MVINTHTNCVQNKESSITILDSFKEPPKNKLIDLELDDTPF